MKQVCSARWAVSGFFAVFVAIVGGHGISSCVDPSTGRAYLPADVEGSSKGVESVEQVEEERCKDGEAGVYRFSCAYTSTRQQAVNSRFGAQVKKVTFEGKEIWLCKSVNVMCVAEDPTKEIAQPCCPGFVPNETECGGVFGQATGPTCPATPSPRGAAFTSDSHPPIIDGLEKKDRIPVADFPTEEEAKKACSQHNATPQRMSAICQSAVSQPTAGYCSCTPEISED